MKAPRIWHLVIGLAIALGTLAAVGPHGVASPSIHAAIPTNPGAPHFPGNPG